MTTGFGVAGKGRGERCRLKMRIVEQEPGRAGKKIYELPKGQGLFATITELIWGSVDVSFALATMGLIHVIPKVNL